MFDQSNFRVSDRDLLILIAQGNIEAKRILDDRYTNYCNSVVDEFLRTHRDYGNSRDDFFNAAIIGYLTARAKFSFEQFDGFYPYFKIWATSYMRLLCDEGKRFYLNENPNKFISLDLTYNKDDEEMIIAESIGNDDEQITEKIRYDEIVKIITEPSNGLTELEIVVCSLLVRKDSEREIRESLKLSYKKYKKCINSIREKLKDKFFNIVK